MNEASKWPCGAPEIALFNLVLGQMARHYEVPSLGVGLNCDAKVAGIQAAYESMETGLAAARAMAVRLAAILRRDGQPKPDQPADASGPGPVSDHRQQLLHVRPASPAARR